MLKTIKKALLLSSFAFSSVLPMRQVGQVALVNVFPKRQVAQIAVARMVNQSASFHNSSVARFPFIFGTLVATMMPLVVFDESVNKSHDEFINESHNQFVNESHDQSVREFNDQFVNESHDQFANNFVAMDCKCDKSDCRVYLDPKNGDAYLAINGADFPDSSSVGAVCSNPSSGSNRSSSNNSQQEQYLSESSHNYKVKEIQRTFFENVKKQVFYYYENFSTIVQDKIAEFVKSCSSSSRQELSDKKADLEQPLPALKTKLLSLTQQNFRIDLFINPEKYGETRGSALRDAQNSWTPQDYYKAKEALDLKLEIESREAAIEECNWRISRFEQEVRDSISSKLENESIDTIEKEITDLATNKGKFDRSVVQVQKDLSKLKSSLYTVEKQLRYFYEERTWVGRWFNKSTINSLWTERTALKEQIAQKTEDLQILKDSQKECDVQLKQAQKIAGEKIKIASQEAQALQDKQEQEAIALHDQTVRGHQDLGDFYSINEEGRNDLQEALDETIKQGYMPYDQQYNLTPQVADILAAHGIDPKDYLGVHGTALQQYLHGRTCDILSQAATLQAQLPYKSTLISTVVYAADAAHDANKNNEVLLASQLTDVAYLVGKLAQEITTAVMPYAQAVVSGLVKGVILDNIDMVVHFDETIKGLGKALYYVSETLVLNDPDMVSECPEIYEPMRDKRNAKVVAVLKTLGEKIENSTGPERLEALVRFGSNIKSADKIIQAVGGACGIIRSQAKGMRTLEGIASLAEDQGIAREVMQAAEQLELVAQEKVAKSLAGELMEAGKNGGKVASGSKGTQQSSVRCKILSLEDAFDQLKKFGYKISKEKPDLLNNIDYYLKQACAKVNTKIESALLEECKKMQQIAGSAEMSVCMDLEHMVNVEYKLIKDGEGAFHTVKLTGGHLAGTMSKLEKEGLVAIESFLEFGNGCKEYKVKDLCTGGKFTHSEFPPHWTVEKIAQETKAACEEAMRNGLLNPEVVRPLKVMTHDGFELQIITNLEPLNHTCAAIENTINRHVVTAYPNYTGVR
ncbi:MAG: hypothetical protein WC747_01910 [Candidatus Babeliales bacterium]